MNFSKKGTADKQKRLRSTSRKMSVKAGVSIFRTFLVCIVMIIIIGVFAGFGALRGIIDNAPGIESIQVAPSGFYTTIYDSKGKEIQRLIGSGANRSNKKLEEIPKVVQNAFIAIEDERFWEHNGIDIRGIFRAFFTGLANGDFDQGASTITQQLLKNQVFEGGMEASFAEKLERKIQEQYLAIQLSARMSKEQILEYYLNTINLGQNTLGVQTASRRYFNKNVEELTLSEAAVIAAITKSPSNLNPITSPEKNAERRQVVLENMKTQGYISAEEYQEAMADDVYERIQQVNEEQNTGTKVNSYFVDELIDQVMEDLQTKLGYTSTQAYNMIYQSGLSIYSTQNTSLQKTCDKILKDESLYPANSEYELIYRLTIVKPDGEKKNYNELMLESYFQKKSPYFTRYFKTKKEAQPYIKEYRDSVMEKGDKIEGEVISYTIQPQISFVLMDQSNGKVLTIVGGRGEKTANRTLNRASDSARQPGSTFKVVSTYLPALDTKGMTLASVKDDAPHNYPGPQSKPIKNWYSGYKGLSTIRQGIYDSMNILTVKFLEDVTPQTSFSYLEKLGFTTLERNYVDEEGKIHTDIGYPMALGGLTKGVTNLELTGAFASIANGGNYNEPIFYTKVVDHDGKVILDNTKRKSTQVMKPATAWLLTSAMQDVVTRGTGTRVRFQKVNMPVAGKTGTTTNDIDLWFVGYTPYYTAGLWGGYDNNKNQSDTSYVKNIWRTIMEKLHEKKERKEFTMPNTITTAKICTKCGKLAVDGLCDRAAGGPAVRTEYFEKGTVPTSACDCHIKVQVCRASNKKPTKYCPKDEIGEKVFLTKTETAATADSPNILPRDFDKKTCTVHAGPDTGISTEPGPGNEGTPGKEPADSPPASSAAPPADTIPPDPVIPPETAAPPEP